MGSIYRSVAIILLGASLAACSSTRSAPSGLSASRSGLVSDIPVVSVNTVRGGSTFAQAAAPSLSRMRALPRTST